jgi:homoisocitrate dehydrogenase
MSMPKLCVIPGDGIGKEVVPAAVDVLQKVVPDLQIVEAEAGWECFQNRQVSVPLETLAALRACGAGLFGAVSSPSRKVEGYRSAIVTMRRELGLYANIRPVKSLAGVSPRPDVDMIIVRENTEDLYIGEETSDGETATAIRRITRTASRRIARRALDIAEQGGRRRMTIVHKANILPLSDGLFRDSVRKEVEEAQAAGLQIEVDELLVDMAALCMVSEPQRFDVIVTTNLYGDILSDAAAPWCGGLGMAPSLNWGENMALAEPVHGSAPDIAGKGVANPIAAILSVALLVRTAWHQNEAAARIESAVKAAVAAGALTGEAHTRKIVKAIISRL